MDDIRWFAPNRFCTLPVSRLREAGLRIATEGTGPARMVVAADGVSAVAAYQFATRHRVLLVLYLWDLPPWQLAGGRPNPILSLAGRLIKVPLPWGRYPERTGYYSRLRFVARHAAEVWVPSQQTAGDVEDRFGVASIAMPFCYDSDRFHRDVLREPAEEPTVLCISRLVAYKNHAAVVRAAALLPVPPRVQIIGRGPEANALVALAASLGVPLDLETAWQSDDQIMAAYRRAWAVVSMSRFEGMGVTPLESIALGIPTVASDIPPHRELGDGRATLVPLDDDGALAVAMGDALAQPTVASGPVTALTIEACAERMVVRFRKMLLQR